MMTAAEACVLEDHSALQAARVMMEHGLGETAVLGHGGRPTGMLTTRSIVQAVIRGSDLAELKTRALMRQQPENGKEAQLQLDPSDSFEHVLEAMSSRGVQSIPVFEGGELIGVVTRPDLRTFLYESPDGLPLPPPDLIRLVAPPRSRRFIFQSFYDFGVHNAHTQRSILRRNGAEIEGREAVLDFGCGCGRVTRHWKDLDGPSLFGSDYSAPAIEWCDTNLPFAEFSVNDAAPPLEYSDGAFDFVYAISVFTHLVEDLQLAWMPELKRILRPGGLLLVTLHGESHLNILPPEHREAFLAGKLVVARPEQSGQSECSAYHPVSYVHETLGKGLEVLDHVPAGLATQQDIVLFRRPA